MKLGKLPASHDPHDILLDQIRLADTPAVKVPPSFGHERLVADWGMLGNDQYGDCVWAGADHETLLWNREAGVTLAFAPENALDDYSACTGFNRDAPETDRGTDVRQALKYRRHTGVVDVLGNRHKIGAYLAVEPGNWQHILEACYLFSAVGIGFEFPGYAMDEFNAGKPWTVRPGGHVDGGHYVPVVGWSHGYLHVVTWGRVQRMSRAFFARYCDEAWAVLSPEFLHAGRSPEGYGLTELKRILAGL